MLEIPFKFFSWLTGIEFRSSEKSPMEKRLLFIGFVLLCFGFYRAVSTLIGYCLIH
mgnify:CR=1 FL=1